MKQLSCVLIFSLASLFVFGQYQIGLIPRVSPDRVISQKVGNTTVEIKYGSPAVKNRDIWGSLIAYDEVWRAGANNATTIEFSNDVVINDQTLVSGKYAFFVIPREHDQWTVIFNKTAKQWGSFDYSSEEDALRVDVTPKKNSTSLENLDYRIEQDGFQHGQISLSWEHISLKIYFDTDYTNRFIEELESRADKAGENVKWVVYLQGAEHLVQLGSNAETAKTWLKKSELLSQDIAEWNEQFYPQDYIKGHLYWTKAKLIAQSGDTKAAIKYAERMMSLGEKPLYYNRKNTREQIDETLAAWKAK